MTEGGVGSVLLGDLVVDLFVVETGEGRTDVVLLSHLEVLSEVLVSAPPVEVDHAERLVSADLMEVGVPDVVLLAVGRHSSVAHGHAVSSVHLSCAIVPVLKHRLFLVLHQEVKCER